MRFTYLDLIAPDIQFYPTMATNWFETNNATQYSFFSTDETKPFIIPGYYGRRCIIEIEMAKALGLIQKKLILLGLSLKVYDAYRPQKAVDFFTQSTEQPDTLLGKRAHYPNVSKRDFHQLSYLSRTSSHTLGTAVDVTITRKQGPAPSKRTDDFLGLWDPESIDMGVGYLCFDEKSWDSYQALTTEQIANRTLLKDIMLEHNFIPLDTEFWHYYFDPKRNKEKYFDFDIVDDYPVLNDLSLNLSLSAHYPYD
jgi:D-alanyl-D-alanine dipeptidase